MGRIGFDPAQSLHPLQTAKNPSVLLPAAARFQFAHSKAMRSGGATTRGALVRPRGRQCGGTTMGSKTRTPNTTRGTLRELIAHRRAHATVVSVTTQPKTRSGAMRCIRGGASHTQTPIPTKTEQNEKDKEKLEHATPAHKYNHQQEHWVITIAPRK